FDCSQTRLFQCCCSTLPRFAGGRNRNRRTVMSSGTRNWKAGLITVVSALALNLVAALILTGNISAAEEVAPNGALAGRVLDSSGAILQGARVQLQGKNL